MHNHKGSIIIETIVMLGLIATMTPILYEHVAERRQDIENINEANTLLLLKNATAEYIEANKESITSGILAPTDIGIDISGYQIGIRKDSSGNIDAMIASARGGTDMKAAKVASLLGVSAGIYSSQNTEKAWGINGVWSEKISNYGFNSLPEGIPVVTTAYDKEDIDEVLLSRIVVDSDLNLGEFALKSTKVNAEEYCFANDELAPDERCITEWPKSGGGNEGCDKPVDLSRSNVYGMYIAPCDGKYNVMVAGVRNGGISSISHNFKAGDKFTVKSIGATSASGAAGGGGTAFYVNNNLVMVAGGGGGTYYGGLNYGGGGYQGGCYDTNRSGGNGSGIIGGCFPLSSAMTGAGGGKGNAQGGTGYCAPGYSCQTETGANAGNAKVTINYGGSAYYGCRESKEILSTEISPYGQYIAPCDGSYIIIVAGVRNGGISSISHNFKAGDVFKISSIGATSASGATGGGGTAFYVNNNLVMVAGGGGGTYYGGLNYGGGGYQGGCYDTNRSGGNGSGIIGGCFPLSSAMTGAGGGKGNAQGGTGYCAPGYSCQTETGANAGNAYGYIYFQGQ